MELPHIGQNCSLRECNRLDFLPVKCDACNGVFCVEHYRYESHKCDNARNKDLQVPVCPLCTQPVGIKRNQLPDVAVSEHIDKYCKGNDSLVGTISSSSQTNLQKCSFKSCKQKDIIYLECQDCRIKFCVKHRHPSDHLCSGPPTRSFESAVVNNWNSFRGSCSNKASSGMIKLKDKAQQISQSGQAALYRLTTNRSSASSSSTANDRQAINSLQGNFSEQEALAIALSESATAQKPPPPTTTAVMRTGQDVDESQDAALARAIFESELEAQRRNTSNTGDNQSQKTNCVLS